MSTKSLRLAVLGAFLSTVALADDEPVSEPTCCAKHGYCCSIEASCCGKTVEEEIFSATFVKDEAAKPTCCDKRAYCCTVKAPCCGKTLVVEVAALATDDPESWLTAPLPFIAVGAAVFAATTVSQLRHDVFAARQFGHCKLKRKIASGGMGDVYEAEHLLLKRRCALKMI